MKSVVLHYFLNWIKGLKKIKYNMKIQLSGFLKQEPHELSAQVSSFAGQFELMQNFIHKQDKFNSWPKQTCLHNYRLL